MQSLRALAAMQLIIVLAITVTKNGHGHRDGETARFIDLGVDKCSTINIICMIYMLYNTYYSYTHWGSFDQTKGFGPSSCALSYILNVC